MQSLRKDDIFNMEFNHIRFLMLINTLIISSRGDDTYSEVICYNCNSYYNKSCETPDTQMVKFITK
ncbi:hypothetical protein L9F63_013059, partial [Diploptera punctata]